MASVAGVLVAGSVEFCASADAGETNSPTASNIVLKRKPALISSRSVLDPPFLPAARTTHARASLPIQAQVR
jgi:hypothetical protein